MPLQSTPTGRLATTQVYQVYNMGTITLLSMALGPVRDRENSVLFERDYLPGCSVVGR
jgi:hypothetical protein